MSIKPCTFEQDLLFSLHKIASPVQRLRTFVHCLSCESCRQRRKEFATTSRVLGALRPGGSTVPLRSTRTRLVVCLAALSLMAAAYSYYAVVHPAWLGGSDGAAAGSAGSCDPPNGQEDAPGKSKNAKAWRAKAA